MRTIDLEAPFPLGRDARLHALALAVWAVAVVVALLRLGA